MTMGPNRDTWTLDKDLLEDLDSVGWEASLL